MLHCINKSTCSYTTISLESTYKKADKMYAKTPSFSANFILPWQQQNEHTYDVKTKKAKKIVREDTFLNITQYCACFSSKSA